MTWIAKTFRWTVGILLLLFFYPIIQEFVIELAREFGAFDKPSARIVNFFSAIANHPWYPFVLVGTSGVLLGLGFDSAARRLDRHQLVKIISRPALVKNSTTTPQEPLEPSDEFALNLGDLFGLLDKHFTYPHFVDSLMAYLKSGRIVAFGYPMLGSWETSPNHGLGPQEEIKAKYWDEADIRWTSMNWSDRTYHRKGGIAYAKLLFVRSEVMTAFFGNEKNWPLQLATA